MAYYLRSHKRRLKRPPEVAVKTAATFHGYNRKTNSYTNEYDGKNNTFSFEFIMKDENYDPTKIFNKDEKRQSIEMSREEAIRVVNELIEHLEKNERKIA